MSQNGKVGFTNSSGDSVSVTVFGNNPGTVDLSVAGFGYTYYDGNHEVSIPIAAVTYIETANNQTGDYSYNVEVGRSLGKYADAGVSIRIDGNSVTGIGDVTMSVDISSDAIGAGVSINQTFSVDESGNITSDVKVTLSTPFGDIDIVDFNLLTVEPGIFDSFIDFIVDPESPLGKAFDIYGNRHGTINAEIDSSLAADFALIATPARRDPLILDLMVMV